MCQRRQVTVDCVAQRDCRMVPGQRGIRCWITATSTLSRSSSSSSSLSSWQKHQGTMRERARGVAGSLGRAASRERAW